MTVLRCKCSHGRSAHTGGIGQCWSKPCGCATYREQEAPPPREELCEFSELPKSGCAHCRTPNAPTITLDRLAPEDVGPRFLARYDGECGACAGLIEEGDTIAALLVMGGYACTGCLP